MKSNENRDMLLALVTVHPGLGMREAARRLGFAMGTMKYHADYLERHGLLFKAKFQGRQLLFGYEAPVGKELAEVVLLRDPHLYQILRLVQGRGPMGQASVLEAVEGPRSSVQHRLNRLQAGGLLESRWVGRQRVYEAVK